MNPRILLGRCHALRTVPSVIVRKLVVTDRHRTMVTEIVLMVITEIVTAVDVIDVADPDRDGNASLLRTMIPLMTAMTVTGLMVVVRRNLTG